MLEALSCLQENILILLTTLFINIFVAYYEHKQGEKYNASKLKVEHRDNALFVAYAPFKKPRILVAVILENEGGGSTKAAPIARSMIDKYLIDLYPNGYMGDPDPQVVKFGMGGTVLLQ